MKTMTINSEASNRRTALSRNRHGSGFTLIELLTVIAVIAILAAILLPAVVSVRINAHKARTTSDLRQVFTAITLYTSANSGVLPGPAFSGISAGFRPTDNSLTRYLAPYLTVIPNPNDALYSTVEELLPTTYEDLATNYNDTTKGPTYITNGSYTTENFSQPFGYPPAGSEPAKPPKRLSQVPDHARNVVFYGLDQENVSGSPGWKASLADSPFFGNDRPFLYWDGHITMTESSSPEEDLP